MRSIALFRHLGLPFAAGHAGIAEIGHARGHAPPPGGCLYVRIHPAVGKTARRTTVDRASRLGLPNHPTTLDATRTSGRHSGVASYPSFGDNHASSLETRFDRQNINIDRVYPSLTGNEKVPADPTSQIELPSRQSAVWEAARDMWAAGIPTGLTRQAIAARIREQLQKRGVDASVPTIFRALRRYPRRPLIRIDRD
jgi:hypothetical protein